ncbi:hypothetical protein T484DRAFT_1851333 [Baffinella frigidus]|nr:hypothetical protein T484DRAFT_1851333 [Cryptophyta sp. CCMP2293]
MNGQLGYDDTAKRGAETNMTDRKALSISSGHSHNCALLDDATIKCWGYNNHGQLGYGHTSNIGDGIDSTGGSGDEMGKDLAAVDLGAGRTALSVFAGQSHVCAMLVRHTADSEGIS